MGLCASGMTFTFYIQYVAYAYILYILDIKQPFKYMYVRGPFHIRSYEAKYVACVHCFICNICCFSTQGKKVMEWEATGWKKKINKYKNIQKHKENTKIKKQVFKMLSRGILKH